LCKGILFEVFPSFKIANCLLSNKILNDLVSLVNFRACKAEFDKEDPEIIEAYLRAAYHGFVLLTGTKYVFFPQVHSFHITFQTISHSLFNFSSYEQDNGIYAFELDRPFALLILNKLAILLNKMERFLECWTISAKFIFLWNNFAFPGVRIFHFCFLFLVCFHK
jgi:hypothetical protein